VKTSTVHRLALIAMLSAAVSARAAAQVAPPTGASAAQRADVEAVAAADASGPDTEWTRWTSGRYRITPGDVLELTFPFVPELNQTLTVQPDGYVSLKELPDLRIQGRTVGQVKADLLEAYGQFVRDPVITVTLKEFQEPYFIAGGEVTKPGRYDLRGATTLTEALALAGGPVRGANLARVVIFRRSAGEQLEAKEIDVRTMYAKRDLSEDLFLRPGDMLFVPKGVLGKLAPMLEVLRRY
jgi:polysaccharide export outer membrane protein